MDKEWPERAPQGAESSASAGRRAQYRRLFEDCWTPIRTVFEGKLQAALLDTLGPLAKSPDEADAKRAKAVLVRERAFVQAYLEALQPELNAAIASFIAAREAEGGKTRMLSLVEHADSEFDAAIDQCGARLRNAVDHEYAAVKLRLINLLQEPELRDTDSPFRLGLFVRAVAGALRQAGVHELDVIPLMRLISSGLGRLVALAYTQIDERLAQSGASAAIPVWQATTIATHGAGRAQTAGTAGAIESAGERAATAGGLDDAQSRSVLLRLLERVQPAAPTAQGPAPQPTAQTEQVPMPQARSAPAAGTSDPALLSAINNALRATASVSAVAAGTGANATVAAETRQGLIDAASRKLDKLTIELMGLLFDGIQRDRHVPNAIKEQLSRLQFPLLKVALADPELFADSKQPGRRLLNRIASTSIGWSPDGEDNRRYFDQVRAAIDSVTLSTDSTKAFEQALEQFERFLDEERTRDDDPVVRARRALAEAENREILAIKATMQVRSAFDGVQLESYLRDFLLDVWVRVLVEASRREKTESGLMRRYLEAIPELVWSVQPKINPGDRKRMISTIPNVLAVLREGLNQIEWPAERVQQFFGKLMGSHANAVKALELAHSSLPQFTPSTVRIKLDGFRIPTDTSDVAPEQVKVSDDAIRHTLAGSAARVTHLSPPPELAEMSLGMDQQDALNKIAGFSRGLWFDLRASDGQTERVVLRWISPKKALYLFTTAVGDRARSLSPDTLVAYLQSGWLVAVESAPLFDRLVDGVKQDLEHAAEKTQGVAN
jgi:hypothetical protein